MELSEKYSRRKIKLKKGVDSPLFLLYGICVIKREIHMFNDELDNLTYEWQTFCEENNLPQLSADELFWEKCDELTKEQKTYTLEFIKRWEETEETY